MEADGSFQYRLRPPTGAVTAVVGRRIVQGILDLALSSVLPALSLLVFLLLAPLGRGSPEEETFVTFLLLLLAPIVWFYAWYWVARPSRYRRGQTTGMAVMGIRVVDSEGGPVSVARLVTRWLLLPLDLALVGLAVMLIDARHRRVGDIVAGTAVIEDWSGKGKLRP